MKVRDSLCWSSVSGYSVRFGLLQVQGWTQGVVAAVGAGDGKGGARKAGKEYEGNIPATVDLPTPPFPLATTMICLTPLMWDRTGAAPRRGIVGGGLESRRGIP
jgi:hypothetical protein